MNMKRTDSIHPLKSPQHEQQNGLGKVNLAEKCSRTILFADATWFAQVCTLNRFNRGVQKMSNICTVQDNLPSTSTVIE